MREPDYSILLKLRPPTKKNVKRISLIGQKFNRLTPFGLMGYHIKTILPYWLCRCDCGNWSIVLQQKLKAHKAKSCGCYRTTATIATHQTHGMTRTPCYRRWGDMKTRCYNLNSKSYENYMGRGIVVCAGFKVFENFYDAMGDAPEGQEVDRVNNNGNYSCGKCLECIQNNWPMNVKWSTDTEQARNKRTTRWITIHGETKSLAEWIEVSGVSFSSAWKQLARGVAPEIVFRVKSP